MICRTIVWINVGLLFIWILWNAFKWKLNKNSTTFLQENEFKNDIYKIIAILS